VAIVDIGLMTLYPKSVIKKRNMGGLSRRRPSTFLGPLLLDNNKSMSE